MNVLIVGVGSIAKKHIASIKQLRDDVCFFALRSSVDSKDIEDVVNLYSIEEVESYTFDFAIISNPTAEHKKTIESLVEYGMPLFIEKPLFHTLDAEDLLRKISDRGIYTYVACNLRFLDSLRYVKNYLLTYERRINEVNSYCGSYLPLWRPNVNYKEVYSSIPEKGGGVHIDLIHEIDYLFWLFGEPVDQKKIFRNKSSIDIRAVDYANYTLIYDSFCASVILNYYRRDAKRILEIVFDEETWQIDLLKNRITSSNGSVIFESKQQIADTYIKQMLFFMDSYLIKKSFNNIDEAYNVLKICIGNDTK